MAKPLDELCREKSIGLEMLAERSRLELSRVQAIYLGRWTPSPAERSAIAAVMDVAVDDICWGHKTPIQHLYGHGPG